MENPIIMLLHILESFFVTTLGGVIFGYSSSQNLKSYFKIGVMFGIYVYVARNLLMFYDLPVVAHIPLSMIVTAILVKKIGKFDWILSSILSVIGFVAAVFNEILLGQFLLNIYNVTPQQIISDTSVHFKVGLSLDVTYIVLLPAIYLFNKRKERNINSVKEISSEIK